MNLIVVGCGRVGAELAYRLHRRGHKVTVIDQREAAFDNLPPDFKGRTVAGQVLNQEVLSRAGIQKAHGLAAVTNSDSLNAAVARVARAVFQVPQVVTRNYDPRWRTIHEALGLQVVSSAVWGAQRLEELLCNRGLCTVFSAGNGEVGIFEVTVPPEWDGRLIGELLPEGVCIPVALTRVGQATLPSSSTRLKAGDVLHASATPEGMAAIRAQLALSEET
jgi:trk system potassium uptake protein TrkA